ncbi:hypothetical protein [Thermococcus sp.]|uniref:HEAT repeat domain-containing protein n=1 Tax=Thermococcus sp. TaxID=35749 RepID=UPI002610AEDA|nr:hypothetical protein [Thermococcus sp.]
MIDYLSILLIKGGELIVDREGLRKDILKWHLKEVRNLAEEHESAFKALVDLLSDENPHVRANVLTIIGDMIADGNLQGELLSPVLDRVIELLNDRDEKVTLKAIEVLNLLLEKGKLSDVDYDKVTEALMGVVKSGIPILGEYAAEGLGNIGVNVARLAYKIVNWLFSIIGSSGKREVHGAAITALTEIASKTDDPKLLNEVFDRVADLLSHPDPYVVERALISIDRLSTRDKYISTKNKLKVIAKIKELKSDVKLGLKAGTVLEKLEKSASIGSVIQSEGELKKTMEVTKYGAEDVDRLLDAGKTEVVAELAKLDPEVMERILNMLEDPDYTRRMDALWVISRITEHLTPTDAYRILPTLGDFLKSKNLWARETAAKTMADIYNLYPGTAKFFSSLIDVLLKSNNPTDIEGGLEMITRLSEKVGGDEFERSAMGIIFKLLDRDDSRSVVLRFLARKAQRLVDMDKEVLFDLVDKLKSLYGKNNGRNDEIIASLIDVIGDVIRLRQRGIVV